MFSGFTKDFLQLIGAKQHGDFFAPLADADLAGAIAAFVYAAVGFTSVVVCGVPVEFVEGAGQAARFGAEGFRFSTKDETPPHGGGEADVGEAEFLQAGLCNDIGAGIGSEEFRAEVDCFVDSANTGCEVVEELFAFVG